MESKPSAKNKNNFRGISGKMRVKGKGSRKKRSGRILHREDYSSGGAGTIYPGDDRWSIKRIIIENLEVSTHKLLINKIGVERRQCLIPKGRVKYRKTSTGN